jgi:hypothetical protein
MGYPTDPVGRSKLLDARSHPSTTAGGGTISNAASAIQSPSMYTNEHLESGLCPLPEDQMLVESTELWGHDYGFGSPALGQDIDYTDINGEVRSAEGHLRSGSHGATSNCSAGMQTFKSGPHSEVPSSVWSPCSDGNSSQNFGTSASTFDQAYDFESSAMEINGAEYFGISTGSNESHVALPNTTHSLVGSRNSDLGWEHGSEGPGYGQFPSTPSIMELDHDLASVQDDFIQPIPRRSGSIDIKNPFQSFITTSSTAGTRNRLRSLFRTKSGNSFRGGKRYATSQYTNNTQDSGYASGFASCLTLEEVRQINSQSLREFNGLYRVACHNLHEPQGKAQCKDIPSCTYCRYSSKLIPQNYFLI